MIKKSCDILTIVGNRPQFIKMASLSKELKKNNISEIIIHTGQHYDSELSTVFFSEMNIPKPDVVLSSPASTHTSMTAGIMLELEKELANFKPKCILLYGDTNSTLAAALVAVKLKIPFAHVEAGPRIYDLDTPEEINRIVADHGARLLFAPDINSIKNLVKENLADKAHFTGDVMYDAYLEYTDKLSDVPNIYSELSFLHNADYALITIHRPNNTDSIEAVENIINIIAKTEMAVVFPMHPRTKAAFERFGKLEELNKLDNLTILSSQSYLNILSLLNNATVVVTDSGGLQKEAFFARKPCIILFYETPWPDILNAGWQILLGCVNDVDISEYVNGITNFRPSGPCANFFGNGHASLAIVNLIKEHFLTHSV